MDAASLLYIAEVLFCAGAICLLHLYERRRLRSPKTRSERAMRIAGIALIAIAAILLLLVYGDAKVSSARFAYMKRVLI